MKYNQQEKSDKQSTQSFKDIALMQKDIETINCSISEINSNIKELKNSIGSELDKKANKETLSTLSKDVDNIENRLWGLLIAVALQFLSLVGLVIGYFITR